MISVPLFVAGYIILHANFSVLWRYFAWCNQTLAVFTLWALTVYLTQKRKPYVITLIPALFMTAVCSTYILIAREGLHLPQELAYWLGGAVTLFIFVLFLVWRNKYLRRNPTIWTGTDSSIKRKGIFMRKIPFRLIPCRGRTAGAKTVRKLISENPGQCCPDPLENLRRRQHRPSSPAQSTTRNRSSRSA